ncbi:aldo/keto reductase [Treponema parvum]|uniref:aldo/keto reductase n=1 Tax=Treponema parvum TaxID=138851 RepID=UPI001AEC1DA7|nr:aldo/keto reductase [Treponema parvum]QTQ16852.1 aldo/keto reductase [Treponema parvum]
MNDYVILRDGTKLSKLGMGTWFLGENSSTKDKEIDAVRTGIENGVTLIDTAEMYGSGKSEMLVGEAIKGFDRTELFLVSKVYPHNAGKAHIFTSCENSLKRLGTDYLDMYLLHWRGSIPLSETVFCMEKLVSEGKIKRWGVSNLDLSDMKELFSIKDGNNCAVDQVLYHVGSKGIEYDLYPWLREHNTAVMAYCPMAQAGSLQYELTENRVLKKIADSRNISVVNLMLVYVLSKPDMIAIPRTGNKKHALENAKMRDIVLTEDEINMIDAEFPPPKRKIPLDVV